MKDLRSPSKRPPVVAALGLTLVLVGTIACQGRRTEAAATAKARAPAAASATLAAPDSTVFWQGAARAISFAKIDADDVEDFIGPCSTAANDAPISVCAFSGATFGLLWRTPTLAGPRNAHAAEQAVLGRRVLFVDALAVAHVLDVESGRETGSVKLDDRASEVCPDERTGRFWVGLATGEGVAIDPTRPSAAAAIRPEACARTDAAYLAAACRFRSKRKSEECLGAAVPPDIDRFHVEKEAVDGQQGVVLGLNEKGTSYPMLVGFDVTRGSPGTLRWSRAVFPGNPLAGPTSGIERVAASGGRAFSSYELDGGSHLVAVSLLDGKTLWDVPSATPSGLIGRPARLYVARWTRLDVRDAATGSLFGGVGSR